jgi:hypothetical protein
MHSHHVSLLSQATQCAFQLRGGGPQPQGQGQPAHSKVMLGMLRLDGPGGVGCGGSPAGSPSHLLEGS